MSRDPAEPLKAALELPADDRAALADSLLASLDREIDQVLRPLGGSKFVVASANWIRKSLPQCPGERSARV
jgi:hypothetical protein